MWIKKSLLYCYKHSTELYKKSCNGSKGLRIENICLVEYEYEYANQVTDVKC